MSKEISHLKISAWPERPTKKTIQISDLSSSLNGNKMMIFKKLRKSQKRKMGQSIGIKWLMKKGRNEKI